MGIAHKFEDNINTDYIISSRRKRDTVDPVVLSQYLMEDIRPGFGPTVKDGDFIVAGENFGCGSAMEIAPMVVVAAKAKAIIAKSYARSFYRNAINIGLLVLEANTDLIEADDELELLGLSTVYNKTKDITIACNPFPELIKGILEEGGIIPYLEHHGEELLPKT